MSPDDARHGTDAGWWTHRRDRESPCQPCRDGHYAANTTAAEDDAELTDGQWVLKNGIKVWEYDDRPPPARIGRRLPVTLSTEAMRRGYSQYRMGIRTEFAITAQREYQRLHKRARRGAA